MANEGAKYVAMWSGPRNVSTALMRSFENREDTQVIDEPFYACYLSKTEYVHPGKEEILSAYSADWKEILEALQGPIASDKKVYFQKHMTHHILPDMDLDAFLSNPKVRHCFLIREPSRVVASFSKVISQSELHIDQTGFPQQLALFNRFIALNHTIPPVIDSHDLLSDPASILSSLCDSIDIPFDSRMLSWPAGPRASDGIWSPYWYSAVIRSTSFSAPSQAPPPSFTDPLLLQILQECSRIYSLMASHKIKPKIKHINV